MGAPQYEQAGADIGGTGTTNTIPRWTGPSTLGDSGITDNGTTVSFVGRNLSSTAAQTWTLASNTNALNIGSGTLVLDTVNNRVGVGTGTPGSRLVVAGTSGTSVISMLETGVRNWAIRSGGAATNIFDIADLTAGASRVAIDSSGNVGIGTASPTTSAATGSLVIGQNNVSQQWAVRVYGGNDANRAPVLSLFRAGNTEGIIAEVKDGVTAALALGVTGGVANFNDATLVAACQVKITSALLDASGSGYGLKLPATPGNADAQTLDCYQENTWTATDGSGASLTFTVNNTAVYTRVGRLVHARIDITFPATANASNALVNLPFASITYGGTTSCFVSGIGQVLAMSNGTGIEFYNAAGSRLTNANLSAARIVCAIVYQAS